MIARRPLREQTAQSLIASRPLREQTAQSLIASRPIREQTAQSLIARRPLREQTNHKHTVGHKPLFVSNYQLLSVMQLPSCNRPQPAIRTIASDPVDWPLFPPLGSIVPGDPDTTRVVLLLPIVPVVVTARRPLREQTAQSLIARRPLRAPVA